MSEINITQLSDPLFMEPMIMDRARKLARELRYRDDVFTVHLVSRMDRGDMGLLPGSPVRIELLWPAVFPILNSKLRSAFSAIKKFGMYQPFAVATHAYFQNEQKIAQRWVRVKIGDDLADTFASLIPKHRLRTIKTTTIQVVDTITGTVVEKTVSTQGDHRDAPFAMWNEVSQIVFTKHPETVDFVEEIVPLSQTNGDGER